MENLFFVIEFPNGLDDFKLFGISGVRCRVCDDCTAFHDNRRVFNEAGIRESFISLKVGHFKSEASERFHIFIVLLDRFLIVRRALTELRG